MPRNRLLKTEVSDLGRHTANGEHILADGTPMPRRYAWTTATGVATTDPEYERAYRLVRKRLDSWFRSRYPRRRSDNAHSFESYRARSPYWSHIVADYCLWACVNDDLKPPEWPKTTASFVAFHKFSMGELSILLGRVKFKTLFQRLYPPIPVYLLVQKVDKNLFRALADEANWVGEKKDLRGMKGLAETFYRRYGVIKTGGSLNILNQTNVNTDERFREVPDETLHESLKLLLPFLTPEEKEAVGLPSDIREVEPQEIGPEDSAKAQG